MPESVCTLHPAAVSVLKLLLLCWRWKDERKAQKAIDKEIPLKKVPKHQVDGFGKQKPRNGNLGWNAMLRKFLMKRLATRFAAADLKGS